MMSWEKRPLHINGMKKIRNVAVISDRMLTGLQWPPLDFYKYMCYPIFTSKRRSAVYTFTPIKGSHFGTSRFEAISDMNIKNEEQRAGYVTYAGR